MHEPIGVSAVTATFLPFDFVIYSRFLLSVLVSSYWSFTRYKFSYSA